MFVNLRVVDGSFLSTLSLRRATSFGNSCTQAVPISIHALLAESDVEKVPADVFYQAFLSTLSLRRATGQKHINSRTNHIISIHALLAESDTTHTPTAYIAPHFYPRSPCGERRLPINDSITLQYAISIHALLAESDARSASKLGGMSISIHALLAESDSQQPAGTTSTTYFYPRSPCGERRSADCNYRNAHPISIHALLAESDRH